MTPKYNIADIIRHKTSSNDKVYMIENVVMPDSPNQHMQHLYSYYFLRDLSDNSTCKAFCDTIDTKNHISLVA